MYVLRETERQTDRQREQRAREQERDGDRQRAEKENPDRTTLSSFVGKVGTIVVRVVG